MSKLVWRDSDNVRYNELNNFGQFGEWSKINHTESSRTPTWHCATLPTHHRSVSERRRKKSVRLPTLLLSPLDGVEWGLSRSGSLYTGKQSLQCPVCPRDVLPIVLWGRAQTPHRKTEAWPTLHTPIIEWPSYGGSSKALPRAGVAHNLRLGRVRTGWPGFDVWQELGGFFLFFTSSRSHPESIQPPIQYESGVYSPGVKRPGREANCSPPSTAEVKNSWSYTST
jgi:hypothetical protein